jgi:hypothetical protein
MDDQSTNRSMPGIPAPLLALGIALILGGSLIALLVAQEVLSVYQQIDDNSFVAALIRRFKDADILFFGGEPLLVTEQGATLIAIFLFILLALLGIHIAVAFIQAGAQLVSPAFPYQLARLKRRIDKLRERVAGMRE